MTPTIGRIVLFNVPEEHQRYLNNSGAQCPAVIVRVFSDTCVNLRVLYDSSTIGWEMSVNQRDPSNVERTWEWPARV